MECYSPGFCGTIAQAPGSGHPKATVCDEFATEAELDIPELLDALTHYEELPEAAIREATERRAEMVPLFVDAIEAYIVDPAPSSERADQLFLVVHMLGSWHEKSAYRCVARLLLCDRSRLDHVLGGAITETLSGIMLNLFDGDPQPLYDVVECETSDEFVRAGMLEVLATLAERGAISKDTFTAYLRQTLTTLRPQGESYVWVGWQSAIALLGIDDLRDSVEQLFDRAGDVDEAPAARHLEPKVFCQTFHVAAAALRGRQRPQ